MSPKKPEGVRTKQALKRRMTTLAESTSKHSRSWLSSGSSHPVTPALSDEDKISEPLSLSISEQLFSDYSVHELPNENMRDGSNLTLS